VEAKTKSSSGIDFTVNCSSNHDTKKFLGSLETKYKWSDYGELMLVAQPIVVLHLLLYLKEVKRNGV